MNVKTVKRIVTKVSILVLVLAVLFKSSIGIGISSTFCQSIVIDIDNSFTSIDNIPGKKKQIAYCKRTKFVL